MSDRLRHLADGGRRTAGTVLAQRICTTVVCPNLADARALSLQAGAAYLGLSRRTVCRFVDQGLLHLVKFPGCRRALLDRKELDALVDRAREGA